MPKKDLASSIFSSTAGSFDLLVRWPTISTFLGVCWSEMNSNTFVAAIMREVPEIDAVLPPNAIGRDYLPQGRMLAFDRAGDLHMTLYGLVGLSAGPKSGVELHIGGLVAGLDIRRPAVKIPAFGRYGL